MYLILIFLLGVALNIPDAYFYPNYFFSHFYIDPWKLNAILAMAFTFVVFRMFSKKKFKVWLMLVLLTFIPVTGATATSLARIARVVKEGSSLSRNNVFSEYGDKVRFIEFVNHQIPENGTVLIPPGILPWRHTGDFYLMQAWLYPRKIMGAKHTGYLSNSLVIENNFVLISSESDGNSTLTWPHFRIPAYKIIIYNWEHQNGEVILDRDYVPEDWKGLQPWGLIIPRKI